MKIRNGFVSNSSSSSFIISDENFSSVRDLATYMIKQKIKESVDYANDGDGDYLEYTEHDKQYIENLKNVDENHPISFPSCNYDTYIRKVGDCYIVSTCNNTDWDLYEYTTRLTDNAKKVLKELLSVYNEGSSDYNTVVDLLDEHYYDDIYNFGIDFYDLNKKIVGVEVYESCPNCSKPGEYMWKVPNFGKICLSFRAWNEYV